MLDTAPTTDTKAQAAPQPQLPAFEIERDDAAARYYGEHVAKHGLAGLMQVLPQMMAIARDVQQRSQEPAP